MDDPYASIQTPYVSILAKALQAAFHNLREKYGDRWFVDIDGTPDNGWQILFTSWDKEGLRSSESFHIGYSGITEDKQ